MSFGAKLKKLREDNKLTQRDLSSKIKISQPTIYEYERDVSMPRPDVIVKIAELFGVTTDYLLGITSTDKNERLDQMARSNPLLSNKDKLDFVKSLSEDQAEALLKELKKRFSDKQND